MTVIRHLTGYARAVLALPASGKQGEAVQLNNEIWFFVEKRWVLVFSRST